MSNKITGDAQFEAAIPTDLQDDLLQRIEECAWEFTTDPDIEIIDVEKRNVLNIEYTGVVRIEGNEHRFHIRSGNNAGTEILSWNADTEISREAGPVMTLVPISGVAAEAIYQGRAAALLREWAEAMDPATETGKRLSGLPGAAAYDAFFAPGTGASRTHHATARTAGYQIEETSVAVRIRRDLLLAAHPIAPLGGDQDPLELLQSWASIEKADTVAGHRTHLLRIQLLDEVARRGGTEPNGEEAERMRVTGFAFCAPSQARRTRTRLTRALLSLEPIEGFDPATLPENPVAVLFNRLDPSLAPDVRVNPELEGSKLLDAAAERMARDRTLTPPEWAGERAAEIGFRFLNRAEPDQEPDLPSP